ncbi:DUF2262 domain-containing protein [Calothrix sp. FACHB-156]|nr:DUF2262 domain-containing protein [Nostoc linckia FACHB-104]MBD2340143.1 DUF2262 domain-containing protein [Calothrix sp. FACHB-156]
MSEQTIQNDILGELVWNSKLKWWSSQVEITPGNIVNVSVDNDDKDITAAIEIACHSFTRIQEQEINLRRFAANQLLELYNEYWNNGDVIDCLSFMELIKLAAVVINTDGSTDIFYDDGELFGGHTIIVSIDCHGAFKEAQIAG